MGVFHILALLAAALPFRAFAANGVALGRAVSRRGSVALASAAALAALSVAYMVTFDRAILEVRPAAVLAALPIHFLNVRADEVARGSRADELLIFALLECVALGTFLCHLGALGTRTRRLTIALVAVTLAATALATRASDSPDPYLYVGLATLGAHAYAPPAVPFGGDLRPINAIWGTPLLASAYGPLWIGLSVVLTKPLTTLAAKLFVFKVIGLGSVFGCAYLARRLGAAQVVVAGIICNPALYLMHVADVHNDLLAVDLVLAAMLAARANVPLAFAFALAAGLIKLTLAPVALVATATLPSFRARASFAALLALALALVYAAHDGLIWHALFDAARKYARPVPPLETAFHAALFVVALASCAWIVVAGRVRSQVAWTPPAFGDFPMPSYFVWGLPFALTSTPIAAVYLVTLPFVAFLQDPVLR